jgi:hypothetical protein
VALEVNHETGFVDTLGVLHDYGAGWSNAC